nr:hypothetical protein [Bacilli bacterium]
MEYLVDKEKSIVVKDTNNEIIFTDIDALKSFLHKLILSKRIISASANSYDDSKKGIKHTIYEYSTEDSKVRFTENMKNAYPDLFIEINTKKVQDMYAATKMEIMNGKRDVFIDVAKYSERKNVCKIVEDDVFKYMLFTDKSGKLTEQEMAKLDKLVETYIDISGINPKYRYLTDLGIIKSEGRNFIGKGEPIEYIVNRKVLMYERKSNNGRIS